jgi:hypothetical protein
MKTFFVVLVVLISALPVWAVESSDTVTTPTKDESTSPTTTESSSSLVQLFDVGSVDWEKGLVTAIGYAAVDIKMENTTQAELMARRGAEVVARRNLLEIVGKVNIDSRTTVNNLMLESDALSSWVKGCIEGSYITRTWQEGEAFYVEVCMPMFGLPGQEKGTSPSGGDSKPLAPGVLDAEKKKLEEAGIVPKEATKEEISQVNPKDISKYTGLVIDATGLGAAPGLAPNIVDETGEVIINATDLDSEYSGMAVLMRYSKSLEAAKKEVGDNPAVVKATELSKDGAIVVDKQSGGFLKALKKLGGWIFQSGLLAMLL